MAGNEILFSESDLASNADFLEKYRDQITIPYDDFLEDHIIGSGFYSIRLGSEICGFFGINNGLLTILFIDDPYFAQGNRIFESIKQAFRLSDVFVPTTDLGLLSLVLENYTEIQIQALHFSDAGGMVRPAEFGEECFRLATMIDLSEIQDLAGDFLPDYGALVAGENLYCLEKEGEILGIGITVRSQIMQDCLSIGVFTGEDKREIGVGRSILLHLKDIACRSGMTPVAGCWYHNTLSRLTLESAGFITKSKLLRVIL